VGSAHRLAQFGAGRRRTIQTSRPVAETASDMAGLLSVNVGLPRDIGWKGRTPGRSVTW